MSQMIDMAKDLIAKGNALGDAELIAMGMQMLEKYQESPIPDFAVVSTPAESAKYVCGNCGHEMEYDKPGRKKCPECKKHRLKLHEPTPVLHKKNLDGMDALRKLNESQDIDTLDPRRATAEDFTMQIRKPNQSRIRYDDNGQPVGMYTRAEQIEGVTNIWRDDGAECNDDPENEELKKITKVSPRTRKPPRMMKVVCDVCHGESMVHPLHAGGRARYVCDRCVRRQRR